MKKFIVVSLLLMLAQQVIAVGGGLGLYRYNTQGALEFLLVKDPTQRHKWRQGFEFPAGSIGDSDHIDIDGFDEKQIDKLSLQQRQVIPIATFLKGSVREALEEIVYIPASCMVSECVYTQRGYIDKKVSKQAIYFVSQEIIGQGAICLYSVGAQSNYVIFFWNVTGYATQSWLTDIVQQRSMLMSKWYFKRPSCIGAEPDEFAWVSAAELKKVIEKARATEKNISRVQGQYHVTSSEFIKQHKHLEKNKKIKLSPGFVGLISKNYNNDMLHHGDGQNSSMLAVIKALSK